MRRVLVPCPAAPLTPPTQPGALNVTCEVASDTSLAVHVPAALRGRASRALSGLRVRLVREASYGDVMLEAPLQDCTQVFAALERARLFRATTRADAATFDGGGRVPEATLEAMLAVARRKQRGTPEHAAQARAAPTRCVARRRVRRRCRAPLAFKLGAAAGATAPARAHALACLASCSDHVAQVAREAEVEELYGRSPAALRATLLPFQRDGVREGMRRGGRLLLADEMGIGKTVQALALATAYAHEGPVLVICPASLRFMWAENAERWWPGLPPRNITVVLGNDNIEQLKDLPRRGGPPSQHAPPRLVITSYHMLLQANLSIHWDGIAWSTVLVDESHNLKATNSLEPAQTRVALQVVSSAPHAILLLFRIATGER